MNGTRSSHLIYSEHLEAAERYLSMAERAEERDDSDWYIRLSRAHAAIAHVAAVRCQP